MADNVSRLPSVDLLERLPDLTPLKAAVAAAELEWDNAPESSDLTQFMVLANRVKAAKEALRIAHEIWGEVGPALVERIRKAEAERDELLLLTDPELHQIDDRDPDALVMLRFPDKRYAFNAESQAPRIANLLREKEAGALCEAKEETSA